MRPHTFKTSDLHPHLPPPLSVRTLADMNKDGKMDRLEFSIAMKLIKLKLQGTSLPSALPIIMKQPPVRAPSLSNPTSAYGTCVFFLLQS